ncbi:MAG TPA: hypothetical protein VII66_03820 [Gemmatimonadaceae bacterium]
MPISITMLAVAALAVATPTPPSTPRPAPASRGSVTNVQPAWRAVRADTIGDLLFTTETLNGRVRFAARGLKNPVPVTTSDFTPDSVRTWTTSAAALAASPSPKMGDMRGLGMALTLNVTTTTTGEAAFGFYVGDAVTDQQVALALTKENVAKLTAGVNSALDAIGH